MTTKTDGSLAGGREQLLAALPDVARWVELRSDLLGGEVTLFGPPAACVVASGDGGAGSTLTVVGYPETRWLRAAAEAYRAAEIVGPFEARPYVERLAREHAVGATLHLLPSGHSLPLEHPTRILTREDAGQLRHVPEALREELLGALARVPLAVACAGDVPVAFCYPGALTETLWDISIDTLVEHRRRGYAASAVAAMVRHLAPTGRQPVWAAAENNPASMQLARKLGFKPVDTIFLLPAAALLPDVGD